MSPRTARTTHKPFALERHTFEAPKPQHSAVAALPSGITARITYLEGAANFTIGNVGSFHLKDLPVLREIFDAVEASAHAAEAAK